MGWLEQRTRGVRNSTILAVGLGVAVLGFVVVVNLLPSSAPPAIAQGRVADTPQAGRPAEQTANVRVPGPTWTYEDLDSASVGSYLCMCGWVKRVDTSIGRPYEPDLERMWPELQLSSVKAVHDIYFADDQSAPEWPVNKRGVHCRQIDGEKPRLKVGDRTCARGRYAGFKRKAGERTGPQLWKCTAVPSCE